jgi:hypothetical protein
MTVHDRTRLTGQLHLLWLHLSSFASLPKEKILSNNTAIQSKVLLGVILVALSTISGLASCGGKEHSSQASPISRVNAPVVLPSSIAAVQAAYAAEAVRGTPHYFCDCGTGAAAGCVAGSDSNDGLSKDTPKRTLASAISTLNALTNTGTVALCQGGAFTGTGSNYLSNSHCTSGTTCFDLREYNPSTFSVAATVKPIINNASGAVTLFNIWNSSNGGFRIMNLRLQGANNGGDNNNGVFIYKGAHDVTFGNVEFDSFTLAFYDESTDGMNSNVKLTGSFISNSYGQGLLGSSNNMEVSYNYWEGNGSNNVFDHTIYISSAVEIYGVSIVGNYIHGQYGSTCQGTAMVAHAAIDGLNVSNNTIEIDSDKTTGGCYGIGFNNVTGNSHAVNYRNAVFSGNIIINGGNTSLTVSSCPGCVIENNLIIQDWASGGAIGIGIDATNRGSDDTNNGNIIRNNTIWFSSVLTGTGTGISLGGEGTGHVVSNNTISSAQTAGSVSCYKYPLTLSSYTFINNNHCYSSVANTWEATRGSLSAWRTTSGFDSASITGAPNFVNASSSTGYDFKPNTGSPLIGAGSSVYKSAMDILGTTRPTQPAVGAYEP